MQYVELKKKRVPFEEADVVVAGGGPGGIGAGIAAGKMGVKTVICEEYGYCGGMMTTGYVLMLPLWLLTPMGDEEKPLVEGVARDFVTRLESMGGIINPDIALKYLNQGEPIFSRTSPWTEIDHEITKIVSQRLLLEAGCEIKYHCKVVDVIMEDDQVQGVVISTKRGLQAILAKVVVDATGDGDISASAGASFDQHFGEGILPMTFQFYMGGIDTEQVHAYQKKDPGFSEIFRKGNLKFRNDLAIPTKPSAISLNYTILPKEMQGKYNQMEHKGMVLVWGLHVHSKDVTNPKDLSESEQWGHENVITLVKFLTENIPGFQNAFLFHSNPGIGTRESRRITGYYRLNSDDINEGRSFSDKICRSLKGAYRIEDIRRQKPFDIPYRCLIPINVENIIVAGRPISIDHTVATFYSPRDIITCMGVGQAAGAAAAIASKSNILPSKINVGQLQEILKGQGANLG